jgi:hypothetical protein
VRDSYAAKPKETELRHPFLPVDAQRRQCHHGIRPEKAVVNSYLQCWDGKNLFIPGALAFPHNSGYTPTETVVEYVITVAQFSEVEVVTHASE